MLTKKNYDMTKKYAVSKKLSWIFFILMLCLRTESWGQTAVTMSSQVGLTYTENFSDIANWTNNFASGTGASAWGAVAINASGTIPDGSRIAISTATFQTSGTSGGVQKGSLSGNPSGTIVLLSTGATSNSSSCAIDLYLNFTGVNAGTISFDWTRVNNSTGDRGGSLRVYTSTDGSIFTELTSAAVNNLINNGGTASGSITTVALPSSFNGISTARIRFYYFNGTTTGSSGSRPKIAIDNVTVNATTPTPSIALSSPSIPTSTINNNTTNNILGAVQLAVTTADATLNNVTFTTAGTYAASDIATNGFKFWLSNSATDISGATQLGTAQAAAGTGSNISVSSLSSIISSGTTRFIVLTADIASSPTSGATIGITSTAHSNITFASGNKTGTDPVAAGTTRSISVATPNISLSSPIASTNNLTQGITNQEIYRFDLAVTTAAATLNGVTINTVGTYSATDITNIKCWYSADNTFNSVSDELLSTKTASLGTGTHAFPTFTSKTISSGLTGYIFITVDLPYTAAENNTISINAITNSDISFLSGNKTGTANASGTKTIVACTPTNVTGLSATAGNGTLIVNWTNPSCLDEIMMVAKPTSSVTTNPTGDGSSYTSNLSFGNGGASAFEGTGFVVYKGTSSPQTITGLTNGTNYFIEVFTRKGTTWSSGNEVNATPEATSTSTDYFRSKATGNWSSLSTWESSSDNTNWINATLTPTSAANTISIRNGHEVTINSNVTLDQVEINNGGTMIYSGGVITVANGTGDDISIQSGGRMTYSLSGTSPTFNSGATLAVLNGGYLRVQATGITGAGVHVNNSSHVYNDGAILEYNLTSSFSASGVTYFPNVSSSVVPIFRLLQNLNSIGGSNATIINGRFELANGIAITWTGNGNKTFRNGITGLGGTNSCSFAIGTGQFLFTGTSNIGSSGSLTVTNANGVVFSANTNLTGALTIGSGTTLTLSSGTLTVGSNTLTLNGNISRTTGNIDASNVSASVVFNGSSAQNIPDGAFTGNINNIIVNNNNGVTNNQTLTIAGTLTLTAGIFDANNVTTLSSTASLIYDGGSIINYNFPTTLNNYTLPTGTSSLSGDLTLTGNLNIGSNTIDIGLNTLTVNGNITRTTGAIKTNGGSLILGGTNSLTLYFDQTTDGTTNKLKDLTINQSGTTVTLGNKLQIAHNGTVTVTAGTLAADGNLVLTSTLGGTARIAALGAGASVSGNVEVQRYMIGGATSQRGWRYMSSPIANTTYSQLIDDIFITGPGGTSNGFDWAGSSSSVMTYEESTNRGWKSISTPTNTWTSGKGAIVFFRGDRTQTSSITNTNVAPNSFALDFNGTINSGNYTVNLDYDNTVGVSTNQGWNLIGNPYPSQIDWDLVTKTSGVNSHYYLINPNSKNYMSANTGVIAIGQGFFVQVNASGQSVTFNESNKTGVSGTAYFKTATNPLTIKMNLDSVQNDIAKIFFLNGANKNYLFTEDAVKLSNTVYNLSLVTPNSVDVQNSYVPLLGVTGTDTFELKVSSTTNNTYSLSFENLQGLPINRAVLLLDKMNNSVTNIRVTPNYTFAINNTQSNSFGKRFLLIITDQQNPLPVKLTQFSGVNKGGYNILNWTTASEKNLIVFEVQKATDGLNFETIGLVKSNNRNTTTHYSLSDNQAYSSKIYYRLKLIYSNYNEYSNTIVLSKSEMSDRKQVIEVYPNPANNILNIKSTDGETINDFSIFDIYGKLVLNASKTDVIDISGLKDGNYILQAEINGQFVKTKFSKLSNQ